MTKFWKENNIKVSIIGALGHIGSIQILDKRMVWNFCLTWYLSNLLLKYLTVVKMGAVQILIPLLGPKMFWRYFITNHK